MAVQKGLRLGFLLFVVSEGLFFMAIFWAYFHSALTPTVELGTQWPPAGIEPVNPFELPLLNSVILLSSASTITYAHHYLIKGDRKHSLYGTLLTIILAVIFTIFQGVEYNVSSFTISDGVFGSCFFFATGFHGLHVIIGFVNGGRLDCNIDGDGYKYMVYKRFVNMGSSASQVVLLGNKRFYTTSSDGSRKSAEFWHQVNSKHKLDEMNPHYLVERFFQNYPDRELAKSSINLDLIKGIMNLHIPGFLLTLKDFNLLKSIKAISLNYPFEQSVHTQIGKALRNGEGTAGVYLFTNKINGDRYVGSSINLATRLKNGYFGKLPLVGQRKIEVSIREHGLANFNLDVFLIPSEARDCVEVDKKTLINLVLSLEQMLIMELNPELNEIKIAGSSPGALSSKNLRNSYLYDEYRKELIYVVKGRKNLANILSCNQNALKRYLAYKNKLYLNRFFIADDMLSEVEYTKNIMSLLELETYLNKIRP